MSAHRRNVYCFCTLALGPEYGNAALMLVRDIAMHCPGIRVVVLTDVGEIFADETNVEAVAFRSNSPVGCYHDKRYVISEALRRYEFCCYLDADCRLRGAPPENLFEGCEDAILAWNVMDFLARFAVEKAGENVRGAPRLNNCDRRLSLGRSVAARLKVDLREAKFLSETCMCFSRRSRDLFRFFALWDKYAGFMQRRGYGWGEGETIGIVAQHLGWKVKSVDPTAWLFKDVLTPATLTDPSTLKLREERRDLSRFAARRTRKARLLLLLPTTVRFLLRTNDRFLLRP